MASATSPQLALLRAKLALAIGPVDLNLAYHEVKAARPDALSEPWSTDMSGPHKLVVFNNKTFTLVEVLAEQLAFRMARGCPPIDAGENIKLYLNDVWQLDLYNMVGLSVLDYRDFSTGRDRMGSLYYSLVKSVDQCIMKKGIEQDGEKENETFSTGYESFWGNEWEEPNVVRGPSFDAFNTPARDTDVETRWLLDSDDETQGGDDSSVECVESEDENVGHAEAVMEG